MSHRPSSGSNQTPRGIAGTVTYVVLAKMIFSRHKNCATGLRDKERL